MKKIIISLACGATLLCGCNKSNTDSAKIDALSQKLDAVLQNEAAIKAQVDSNGQMGLYYYTNGMDRVFYYYTNMVDLSGLEQKSIESKVEATAASQADIQFAAMSGLIERECDLVLTNIAAIPTPAASPNTPQDPVSRVLKIERESDFEQMKTDVDDIKEDLIKIKARLGIN